MFYKSPCPDHVDVELNVDASQFSLDLLRYLSFPYPSPSISFLARKTQNQGTTKARLASLVLSLSLLFSSPFPIPSHAGVLRSFAVLSSSSTRCALHFSMCDRPSVYIYACVYESKKEKAKKKSIMSKKEEDLSEGCLLGRVKTVEDESTKQSEDKKRVKQCTKKARRARRRERGGETRKQRRRWHQAFCALSFPVSVSCCSTN